MNLPEGLSEAEEFFLLGLLSIFLLVARKRDRSLGDG